jgi:phosphate transport system permease protein
MRRYRLGVEFFFLLLAVPVIACVARPLEICLFSGNIKAWLGGRIGSGFGGWMLLLFPASAVLIAVLFVRVVNPWLRAHSRGWSRRRFAIADMLKFLLGGAVAIGVSVMVSWLLSAAGCDPRGSYLDTYVQRNAMVVGIIMGFAIIPIIYTLAEDALAAVPEHLRAASLGAGATHWQTAVRIILPTAMSGLFSAVMIGFGRAIGETMVVLMAAGNTPVLDWNIFDGFRTLSADIAVELPEAVQYSTHYRVLFLAALSLFVMTFILNTVAELVRLRFRKKAFRL